MAVWLTCWLLDLWLVSVVLMVAGFEFDRRDSQALAEVDSGGVNWQASYSHPEVKLITGAVAFETAEDLFHRMDGEAALAMTEWARTAPLLSGDISTRVVE